MKIDSLLETSAGATGSGSVASVASPVGGMQKRGGSMFAGKKTSKPFYEEKDEVCETCEHSKSECTCDKEKVDEHIVKHGSGYRLVSKKSGKNLGDFPSKKAAQKHEREVQYFKHMKESGIMNGVMEADLHEDDFILMPGQGTRFKQDLMPKKTDHEIEMARGQLYQSAKDAKDICDMLKGVSEIQGIDAWVQAKITKAADYLETVRSYLESKYEMQDEIDEATAREKFNKGLKRAGYDPVAGGDRLLALIAKQKREREEHEKQYGHLYPKDDEKDGHEVEENWTRDPWNEKHFGPTEVIKKIYSVKTSDGKKYRVRAETENDAIKTVEEHLPGAEIVSIKFVSNIMHEEDMEEGKPGLWANIHAKRERIKHGSGEHMRKPGSKGAPTDQAIRAAQGKK